MTETEDRLFCYLL